MSRNASERGQLDLFHALPGEFAVRDAQDLMSYPFFSLSKSHRTRPIEFSAGGIEIRVEAVADQAVRRALNGEEPAIPPAPAERLAMFQRHLQLSGREHGDVYGLNMARRLRCG